MAAIALRLAMANFAGSRDKVIYYNLQARSIREAENAKCQEDGNRPRSHPASASDERRLDVARPGELILGDSEWLRPLFKERAAS